MFMNRKVVIIGDGAVGSTLAYTLAIGDAVNDIVIVDLNKNKAEAKGGLNMCEVEKIVKGTE